MKKSILFAFIFASFIFVGCQKQGENWVGFYYPDGAPEVGAVNCEIAEFAMESECQNWAEEKILDVPGADYFCGFQCKYDSDCQYACSEPKPVACTEDAKLCPDGSAVGRVLPDCEFAECPSFEIPADFDSEFISPVEWPPVVEFRDEKFDCADGEMRGDFCVVETSEGAAGSIYSTFEYSKKYDDGTLALTFTIREPQCPNYPEPQMSECAADQNNLNLDAIVGKIFASFNFTK